ncbi:MAG: iron-sulfur cluster repair di-iron protein [Sandaracinaceae bacterium]|jgi:regulator of cell morphogenesis and NO signaling|nr:iron-sulfur cluster repair di-iron protein [Sandaracinaceae bacterium]
MLDRQQTIANVVLDHSECAQVFQRHRIDFCCRGGVSIEAAAALGKVDVEVLVRELTQAIEDRHGEARADRRELSTPQLIEYIVATHHAYLRKALPFVLALAEKVGRVHGARNPKLNEIASAVQELGDALLPHLDFEEGVLFPKLLDAHTGPTELHEPLAEMQSEHLVVAKLLRTIRSAADDFALPDWACNSYRTLFSELQQMESDIFEHVHLENHVLEPRAKGARNGKT